MSKKKFQAFLGISLIVLILVAPVIMAAPKEMKITWFTCQGKFKDVYKDMAAQLKADENISVDFQVVPDDQYYNMVKVKLATGEVPDVFEYNTPTQNEELNVYQNCLDLSKEPWIKRLTNPRLLKDAKNGKIYAMPKEASSFFGACYYNKKVFKELGLTEPKTYADFFALLDKIKKSGKGIVPIYAADKDTWTTQIFCTLGYAVALHPKESQTYQKLLTNKMKWAEVPEFKQILGDFLSLYKKGYVNEDHLSANYDMSKEAVATGKAAMILQGEWAAADIKAKWPDVELGAFPINFNNKGIMATGAYVQGLFIPKAGKQVQNVRRFLNLWSQPKYQNMMYASNPGFPGFKDVDGGKVVPCVKSLVDNYVAKGKFTYQINDPMGIAAPAFENLWKLYAEATVTGKTAEQTLRSFDAIYADFMKSKQQPGF